MCFVNCVVSLTDQRPFFLNLLPVFLLYFCYTVQQAFLCYYSATVLKYRVNFFILRKSKRLNIMRN